MYCGVGCIFIAIIYKDLMGNIYKVICESCNYEDSFTYGQGMVYGKINKVYYGKNKFISKVESTVINLIPNFEEDKIKKEREEVDLDAVCGQKIRCPKCKNISLEVLDVGEWD